MYVLLIVVCVYLIFDFMSLRRYCCAVDMDERHVEYERLKQFR